MTDYTMTRSTDDNGKIMFAFTSKAYPDADPLLLSPDDYQSGAKMKARVISWIGTLGATN